nr:RHS repeat-associated core domain-containing protein [Sorangium cellulosum]
MIERRSYDPFGQRRNPVWGQTAPASFSSTTTQRFTGHESDDELGLVNMKGRLYDPRIGRFLPTDPIVSMPSFGQSWNPYSYVLNNPLAYVDPGGFQEALPEAGARSPLPAGAEFSWEVLDLSPIGLKLIVVPSSEHEARSDAATNTVAAETGGAMPPIDVSTTGSASGYVSQPVTTAQEHTGAGAVVGQSLLGAAEGTGDVGMGIARLLVLNALTLGIYSGYEFGGAVLEGYEEDGILGALNAVNPLYQIGRGGADTALAIDRGDYREAGAAGTKTMILAAVTVFGMGRGLGAAPEESAALGSVRAGVVAGEAGQFAALDARAVVGDALTPHHMPQAALGFTSRAEGGALVMTNAEHALTRTYFAKGVATARAEAGLSFRRVLARDIRDVRQIVGPKYDQGLRDGPPPLPSTPPTAPGGRDGTEKEEGVHARVQGGGGTAGEGERPEHRPGGEGPRPDRDGAARLDQARGHRRGPRPAGGADDAGA